MQPLHPPPFPSLLHKWVHVHVCSGFKGCLKAVCNPENATGIYMYMYKWGSRWLLYVHTCTCMQCNCATIVHVCTIFASGLEVFVGFLETLDTLCSPVPLQKQDYICIQMDNGLVCTRAVLCVIRSLMGWRPAWPTCTHKITKHSEHLIRVIQKLTHMLRLAYLCTYTHHVHWLVQVVKIS